MLHLCAWRGTSATACIRRRQMIILWLTFALLRARLLVPALPQRVHLRNFRVPSTTACHRRLGLRPVSRGEQCKLKHMTPRALSPSGSAQGSLYNVTRKRRMAQTAFALLRACSTSGKCPTFRDLASYLRATLVMAVQPTVHIADVFFYSQSRKDLP